VNYVRNKRIIDGIGDVLATLQDLGFNIYLRKPGKTANGMPILKSLRAGKSRQSRKQKKNSLAYRHK